MSENTSYTLDSLDWAILSELQENARLSYAEIGRRVGLSAPAVTERVKSLEESGVIDGYTTRIRPEKVGLPVSAFIRIRFHGADLETFFKQVRSHEAVSECDRVTARDDIVLRLRAASVNRLEEHLDAFLDYGEITTSIVLSSAVEDRPIHKEATPSS